jgi:hypothetical protein
MYLYFPDMPVLFLSLSEELLANTEPHSLKVGSLARHLNRGPTANKTQVQSTQPRRPVSAV